MEMSDITLRTAVYAKVTGRAMARSVASGAARGAARAADRLRREQTGQDVLEYVGMIVLVAAVIALLFGLDLPQKAADAVASAVNSIFSQGKSSYSAPVVTSKG
jgi:hypothetical protein